MHYSIKNGFFMLLLLAQSLLAQPANEAAHYARVMQEAQHIVQQNKPDMVRTTFIHGRCGAIPGN